MSFGMNLISTIGRAAEKSIASCLIIQRLHFMTFYRKEDLRDRRLREFLTAEIKETTLNTF